MRTRSQAPTAGWGAPWYTVAFVVLALPVLVVGALTMLQPAEGQAPPDGDGAMAAGQAQIEEGGVALAPLAERSHVLAPDGTPLAHVHGLYNRRVVSLEALPDHVWQAVLAAEDRRFFGHGGYDSLAMVRATGANVRAGRVVQGGSTISQQLAKQFVGAEITLERKLRELRVARALEDRYDKETLLERYLNEVYFGAGAYGIAAAAEEYHNVSPEDLSVDQAALLAGIIRAPGALNPRLAPEEARERRNVVLRAMAEEGFVEGDVAAAARAAPLEIFPRRDGRHRDPRVVAAVVREFLAHPGFGETRQERAELLLTGGLQITTTIDVGLQQRTAELIRQHFPEPGALTAAIAAVDPVSGAVRAVTDGRAFERDQSNVALQGRRQPGSAFKTFVFAAALAEGEPMGGLRGASGSRFGTEGATGDWATRGVRNFGGASYGRVTGREALVRSINTAFAHLVMRVGADTVIDLTDRLGISREAYGGLENAGIALGGLEHGVSPLEMASAYGTFANLGIHTNAHVIDRVLDRDGQEIHRADPGPVQVLPPEVNAQVLDALTDVVRRGTGTRAQLAGWPVAGKTGTTQDNHDVWFVGTTPALSAAVWIGNPEQRQPLAGMSSSRTAAPLWREFMELALEGVDPVAFR